MKSASASARIFITNTETGRQREGKEGGREGREGREGGKGRRQGEREGWR